MIDNQSINHLAIFLKLMQVDLSFGFHWSCHLQSIVMIPTKEKKLFYFNLDFHNI
jgi:hypothetical protein